MMPELSDEIKKRIAETENTATYVRGLFTADTRTVGQLVYLSDGELKGTTAYVPESSTRLLIQVVDSEARASDKDLPVVHREIIYERLKGNIFVEVKSGNDKDV